MTDHVSSYDKHAPARNQSRELDRREFLSGLALSAGALALSSSRTTEGATAPEQPLIVITTPTGNIGSQVLANVVGKGVRVRVIARDPERIPASLRELIDVVQGSHSEPDVCNRAFEDADTVFWLCPPNPRADSAMAAYVDFTRPACSALKTQRVRRVVGISALGRGHPFARNAGFVTASHAMDDLIASTGVHYFTLTMPSFMDNIARQAGPIKERGVFFSPIDGDRKMPMCATRDIAAVAADLLLDPSWTGRRDVPILGPEDLSFNDMARIMSEVLQKPVRFQQISFEQYKAGFIERGASEAMARGWLDMARAKSEGLDNVLVRTRESTTPTSFRKWCEEELEPIVVGT